MSDQVKTVSVEISHKLKQDAELVFAYQMRDQIAVRGQIAVQNDFDVWFRNYIMDKLEQESKAIKARIDQKKWNGVIELQKKFGYTYETACKQMGVDGSRAKVENNVIQPTQDKKTA